MHLNSDKKCFVEWKVCGNKPFTSPFYMRTKDVSHDSSVHEARRGKRMSALVNMDEAETDVDKEGKAADS